LVLLGVSRRGALCDPVSSGTVVPVLRSANKKPPGRRHRR